MPQSFLIHTSESHSQWSSDYLNDAIVLRKGGELFVNGLVELAGLEEHRIKKADRLVMSVSPRNCRFFTALSVGSYWRGDVGR